MDSNMSTNKNHDIHNLHVGIPKSFSPSHSPEHTLEHTLVTDSQCQSSMDAVLNVLLQKLR